MNFTDAGKQWRVLHDAWAEAHVAADEARHACTKKFVTGPTPTVDELRNADKLEARASELRDAMDEFVGSYFGD